MAGQLFDRASLGAALTELATRLDAQAVSAGIHVVGGAALSMEYYDRDVTYDIDGLVLGSPETRQAVLAVVTEMAAERGWSADWFNTAVVMYNPPGGDPQWKQVISIGSVTVSVASRDMLLAMKLNAARGRRDNRDLDYLLDACSISSLADAETVFETYYPNEALKFRAIAAVERWLETQSTSTELGPAAEG